MIPTKESIGKIVAPAKGEKTVTAGITLHPATSPRFLLAPFAGIGLNLKYSNIRPPRIQRTPHALPFGLPDS